MTDDLKERLLSWHPGQDEEALREEAVARITDLEARLAESQAAEEGALMMLTQTIAERDSERAHADMLAQALAAIDTKGELDAEIAQLESVRAKKEEAGE